MQLPNETIEQYITRLQQRAETCEFGDRNAIGEQIRDQVVDKCLNHSLRRKLLEKGRTLNLTVLRETAKAFKDFARQAKAIENHMQAVKSDVNRVQFVKKKFPGASSSHSAKPASMCYSCGFEGHLRTDPKCPALGKKCRKCSQVGHFEKQCKTKDRNKHFKRKQGKVQQMLEQLPNVSSDDEYAFSVNQINSVTENIVVNVGNVDLKMIINSGASCNIIGKQLWNFLKENHAACVSSKSTKELYAYGTQEPLKIAGTFTTTVKCNSKTIHDVEFVVIDGKGQALLGRDTTLILGVIKLIHNVTEPTTAPKDIFDKYPECFKGVGKLESFQLKIPIDPEVEPVIQPLRQKPFNLRDKVEKKLNELLDLDIIERVEEPSSWVSPIV